MPSQLLILLLPFILLFLNPGFETIFLLKRLELILEVGYLLLVLGLAIAQQQIGLLLERQILCEYIDFLASTFIAVFGAQQVGAHLLVILDLLDQQIR
jgi:hypothetical protein